MDRKPDIQDVLEAVHVLSTQMDTRFQQVDIRFECMDQKMGEMETRIDQKMGEMETRIDQKMGEMEFRIDQKMGEMEFRIDGKMEAVQSRMDQKMEAMENHLMNHIDGFIVLHNKLDVELVALRSHQNRQDSFLIQVAKKLDIRYEA
jgi:hypothetical protein